ncbi:MAG: sensor histidine kinase [Gammaproteobacteria bacterium]|nr:MAG: sensor histidine kinase [Gammaproteobacteria bacterium]
MNLPDQHSHDDSGNLLADFCGFNAMLLVVVIMTLLSFILLMSSWGSLTKGWEELGLIALFLQWVGLSSLVVLCVFKPVLKKLSRPASALVTFVIIQLVTLLVSEIGYLLTQQLPLLSTLEPEQHMFFLLRNLMISAIISGIALRYMFLQQQSQIQSQAENRAKIQELQARIRPHFFFNSMNTIAALTQIDADKAENAIEDLSEIFRASLKSDLSMTTLEQEVELTQRYLAMEKLRLHDRLQIDWQIDSATLKNSIPKLTLQPLVENAVYHGIESLREGGQITIQSTMNKIIHIRISNPLPQNDATQRRGNQIAIQNICDRLEIAFGKKASLHARQNENQYTVELELPITSPP